MLEINKSTQNENYNSEFFCPPTFQSCTALSNVNWNILLTWGLIRGFWSKITINKKVLSNPAGIAWISISNYCAWKSASPPRDCVILLAFNHVFIKLICLIIHLLLSLSPILLPAHTELIIHPALHSYFDYSLHVSNVLSSCTHCIPYALVSPAPPTADPNGHIDMNKLSKCVRTVCLYLWACDTLE